MIRVKAQTAGNGRSLSKVCNAGSDHLGGSLRAGREAPARVVAPLGKGTAIASEARLAVKRFTAR